MCGIHAVVSTSRGDQQLHENLRQSLSDRGPDYLGQATRSLPTNVPDRHALLTFTSTVLALRGDHVAKQPFEDTQSGSVLCWNGEAWKIAEHIVDGNDGEAIFAHLRANTYPDIGQRRDHTLDVFRRLQGPFAFLYYDAPGKCLYFGRDRLGRRSLLINQPANADTIAFSSIADPLTPMWKEVAADGIYQLSLDHGDIGDAFIRRYDWTYAGEADLVSARWLLQIDTALTLISIGPKHWEIQRD